VSTVNIIAGTTHIDRPVDTVFETLADPRREPAYNSAILSAEKVSPGPIGVSTRFVQRARSFGGAGEVSIDLVQYDRPRHLGWHVVSSGMDVRGELEFAPAGGGTTVRWRWRFLPLGRLRALGPLVGVAGAAMEHRVWRRLKRHLEEEVAWEVVPDVFCLGPAGRTRTNVFFLRTDAGWVLVDTGWAGDAHRIRAAAAAVFGDRSPVAIVLTHAHPDHSGSALSLADGWGCPVLMHPAELPIATGDFEEIRAAAGPLDRWVILPLMRVVGGRRRNAILRRGSLAGHADGCLADNEEPPHLPGWRCLASPGHTPGHLSLLRAVDGVLITGDALVTVEMNRLTRLLRPGLSEPPWYTTWDRRVARDSIRMLAGHDAAVVLPGHGVPLVGDGTAGWVRSFSEAMEPTMQRSEDRVERGVVANSRLGDPS
jgi:glyoxylase-like metal-dependent hydrolase (beta-lactamase superfamily II)